MTLALLCPALGVAAVVRVVTAKVEFIEARNRLVGLALLFLTPYSTRSYRVNVNKANDVIRYFRWNAPRHGRTMNAASVLLPLESKQCDLIGNKVNGGVGLTLKLESSSIS